MPRGTRLRRVTKQDVDNVAKIHTAMSLQKHELEHAMLGMVKRAK